MILLTVPQQRGSVTVIVPRRFSPSSRYPQLYIRTILDIHPAPIALNRGNVSAGVFTTFSTSALNREWSRSKPTERQVADATVAKDTLDPRWKLIRFPMESADDALSAAYRCRERRVRTDRCLLIRMRSGSPLTVKF